MFIQILNQQNKSISYFLTELILIISLKVFRNTNNDFLPLASINNNNGSEAN